MCAAHAQTCLSHATPVSNRIRAFFSHGTLLTDIDELINTVPPKFYFPPDPEEIARKFQKYTGKVQKAPKHERKMAKMERKRASLYPDQPNTSEVLAADNDAPGSRPACRARFAAVL